MIRTQIQLTPEQAQWLKQKAAEENVSMAEFIRINLDSIMRKNSLIDQGQLRRRAKQAAGSLSGPGDMAEKHDQHLSEAYHR